MANEIATTTEQNQVTAKLLNDYLNTITDKLTNAQRDQFIAVASAFGLNPFKREIYATTYRNKDGQTVMSIVTGYEVYLKRAEMNPNYDGFETEFKVVDKQMNCTCKVYRKDRRMPITSTVWMAEYSTGRSLWATKPRMMLEKVAIATAFRRAFPTDFGGMPYTNDELPEHMTGADKLEQQGYTEVQQAAPVAQVEPPKAAKTELGTPAEDYNTQTAPLFPEESDEDKRKKADFVKAMAQLKASHEEKYTQVMGSLGYEAASEVPAAERRKVFKAIQAEINKEADNG